MELDAVQLPVPVRNDGHPRVLGVPETEKPAGSAATWSPWLIQTPLPGEPREQAASSSTEVGESVLPQRRGLDLPAEQVGHELEAVTDAEHRYSQAERSRTGMGAA